MKKEKCIHPITNKSKIQPEDLDRKEKLNQSSKPSIFQLIFAQEGTIEKKNVSDWFFFSLASFYDSLVYWP